MQKSKKTYFTSGRNINILISIVIALFLWTYVVAEVNPVTQQTMVGIPVHLLNAETITSSGLAVAGNLEYTVDVVIEGKRRDIVKVTPDDVVATADMIGLGKGENSLNVVVALPEGMSIIEIQPAKIKAVIEALVTVEKPVMLEFSGQAEDTFEPGQIKIDPLAANVTGAESAVKAVSAIRATLKMEDLNTDTKTIQVKAEPVDKTGALVGNVTVSIENIQITGRMLHTKEVKLNVPIIGQLNPIYEIKNVNIPGTIKIKGETVLIAGIEAIETEPIDITGLQRTEQLTIKPIFPEGVEVAAGSEKLMAEIGIQELLTKEFIFSGNEIEIRNLDSALSASVKSAEIVVTAVGSPDMINSLVKEDIKPFVDLTDKTDGVGDVTVGLECTKNITTLLSIPAVVYVVIIIN
jgi:YbbR domain-containing protein